MEATLYRDEWKKSAECWVNIDVRRSGEDKGTEDSSALHKKDLVDVTEEI